ncbi:MAG: response regulator [Endomicrobiales bacterium]
MKNIYTTFEIAHLCNVDISTVINWIDSGKLIAYKTPGGHRRIRGDNFIKFLKAYGLPVPRGMGGNGLTALIIDDDNGQRQHLVEEIKSKWPGMDIHEASNGFVAGKLLAERQPDLVILDAGLKGVDVYEVCCLIKTDRRLKHTRILAVTSFNDETKRQELIDAGADECLAHPVDVNELFASISAVLHNGVKAAS